MAAPTGSRVHRHVLVGLRRLRQRGVRRQFDASDGISVGIGFLGVALAFGLTVLTGVYAFGTISGGHFNPAVTLGAALARRVEWKAVPGYWVTQVVGGLVAGMVIYVDRQGQGGFDRDRQHGRQRIRRTFARRLLAVGGDRHRGRPDRFFLLVILGSTDDRGSQKASRACRSA